MAYEELLSGTVGIANGGTGATTLANAKTNLEIPSALSDLSDDSTHRLTTDTEKQTWNGKQDTIPANTYDAYGSASAVQTNLNTHAGDSNIHVTSTEKSTWSGKQDTISDLSTIRSGAAAGATALQSVPNLPASIITSGTFADERIASAATWNAKQSAISDLSTIRSGAALGATALQSVPVATASTLGGIKVGSGLSISNGVLSSSGKSCIYYIPLYTPTSTSVWYDTCTSSYSTTLYSGWENIPFTSAKRMRLIFECHVGLYSKSSSATAASCSIWNPSGNKHESMTIANPESSTETSPFPYYAACEQIFYKGFGYSDSRAQYGYLGGAVKYGEYEDSVGISTYMSDVMSGTDSIYYIEFSSTNCSSSYPSSLGKCGLIIELDF